MIKQLHGPAANPERFWFWDSEGSLEKYPLRIEIKINGLPGVVTNVNFDYKREGVEVSGIYGRYEDGFIMGLSCDELKSHSWENATSLYDKNHMECCRRCGKCRDTGRPITAEERAEAEAEFAVARARALAMCGWDDVNDGWATMEGMEL